MRKMGLNFVVLCSHADICITVLLLQIFVVRIKNFALKFSVQNEVRDIQLYFYIIQSYFYHSMLCFNKCLFAFVVADNMHTAFVLKSVLTYIR